MSTSWVASVVRAKALAERRLGEGGARALAARPVLAEAVAALHSTPYGHDVRPGMSLAEAQHAVGATLLWNMRVLAGWLPRGGADVIRLLAAGFEVANLDEHLATLHGGAVDPSYQLGTLDTAWSRVSYATTARWGRRGARHLAVATARPRRSRGRCRSVLRLAWADAVVAGVPEAAGWARAAAVLLVLREVLLEGRRLPHAAGATRRVRGWAPRSSTRQRRAGPICRRHTHCSPATPGGCSRDSTGSRTCGGRRRGGGSGSSTTASDCCAGRRTTRDRWWAPSRCWPPTPGASGPRSRWPRAAVRAALEAFDGVA